MLCIYHYIRPLQPIVVTIQGGGHAHVCRMMHSVYYLFHTFEFMEVFGWHVWNTVVPLKPKKTFIRFKTIFDRSFQGGMYLLMCL
jgi:hypothetical protein